MTDPAMTSLLWYVPVINCNTDHVWSDITTYNDLPCHRFLCAACGAEYIESPTCTGASDARGNT